MKKVLHTASGLFTALTFLLSFFPMAGLDGDCTLLCMQVLFVLYAITCFWYFLYTFTGTEND